jgi:hypothetical protein
MRKINRMIYFHSLNMALFLLGIKLISSSKYPSPPSYGFPLISDAHSQNRAIFCME